MKILVGLGNPGAEYFFTRHNLGSLIIEHLAGEWGVKFQRELPHGHWIGRCERFGETLLLCRSLSFMNLSGVAIREILHHHKSHPKDLVIVLDDVSLPLGTLRVRAHGSAGGHNGLKSVIEELGTKEFVRVRSGIDSKRRRQEDLADFVLSNFSRSEQKLLGEVVQDAQLAIEVMLREGVAKAMTLFNKRGQGL